VIFGASNRESVTQVGEKWRCGLGARGRVRGWIVELAAWRTAKSGCATKERAGLSPALPLQEKDGRLEVPATQKELRKGAAPCEKQEEASCACLLSRG
jgi:hypothetical protein